MKESWASLGLWGEQSFVLLFFFPSVCATGCCCPETGKYCPPPPPFFRDHFGRATDVPISTPFPSGGGHCDQSKVGRGHHSGDREEEEEEIEFAVSFAPGTLRLIGSEKPRNRMEAGEEGEEEHKTDGPRFPTREILARSEKKGPHLQAKGQGAEIKENLFFLFRPGQSGTHNV